MRYAHPTPENRIKAVEGLAAVFGGSERLLMVRGKREQVWSPSCLKIRLSLILR